jgi:hypothetical protein
LKNEKYWKWLNITMNGVAREGIGWLQLAENNSNNIYSKNNQDINISSSGISSIRDIVLRPYGQKGRITINGCNNPEYIEDYDSDNNNVEIKITVDDLFTNGIVMGSCIFVVQANNDFGCPGDYCKKERAFLYVNAYKEHGAFVALPIVYIKDNKICFDFKDPFVVGVRVDDNISKRLNQSKLCVINDKTTYEVEAITSVLREFYGLCSWNGSGCDWEVK